MKKISLAIFALLAAVNAHAVGPLINGNQINPQTEISISTLNVTGAYGLSVTGPVTSSSMTATGSGFKGAGTGLTGTAASLTAGNVTTNANLTGPITSVGNATSIPGPVPAAAIDLSTVTTALALKAPLTNPTFITTATVNGNAFSVGGSTFVVTGGNVGIGTTSPGFPLTLVGQSNLSIEGNTGELVGVTGNASTFASCVTGSTVTLTTTGNAVQISVSGDWQNGTATDACKMWVLQDGQFINGETTNVPWAQHSSATVADQISRTSDVWGGNPAAGSHSYCFGLGITIGGTCTFGINVFSGMDVKTIR